MASWDDKDTGESISVYSLRVFNTYETQAGEARPRRTLGFHGDTIHDTSMVKVEVFPPDIQPTVTGTFVPTSEFSNGRGA